MCDKIRTIWNKVPPSHRSKHSILKNILSIHTGSCFQIYKNIFQNPNQGSNTQLTSQGLKTKVGVDRETFISDVVAGILSNKRGGATTKKIVIDFSSPNIAKPFHAGHLRSTIIGNFIANINTHFNNKVTRINYLGDWGTQFGLLQYGLQAKNIDLNQLQSNPMKILYDAYVHANKLCSTDETIKEQARKYFADIEQGKTSLESWKKIREVTITELASVYRRLGIQFDEYHWESDYNGEAIKDTMSFLEENNILRTDELGKKVTTWNGKDITVLKSDNSTLYLSRDIAALLDRHQRYQFDKMLYVVDNSQTDHFNAVFSVVGQVNRECSEACQHVKFGRIKGMSTRTGNVVFLNDLLDEAKQKMHEKQLNSKSNNTSKLVDYH